MVRRLRIGELKVAGRIFRRWAEHGPVAQRQRNVGAGQYCETRAGRVGKGELEWAIQQLLQASQDHRCAKNRRLHFERADVAAIAARGIGDVGQIGWSRQAALVGVAHEVCDRVSFALVNRWAVGQQRVSEGRATVV